MVWALLLPIPFGILLLLASDSRKQKEDANNRCLELRKLNSWKENVVEVGCKFLQWLKYILVCAAYFDCSNQTEVLKVVFPDFRGKYFFEGLVLVV